eukprot:scaffold91459_cov31-Tisochrysis_lutea.AAC.1
MEVHSELSSHGGSQPEPHSVEHRGWRLTCTKGPMAGAQDLDELSAALGPHELPPLPEIIFAANSLSLHHHASGFALRFRAEGGLRVWAERSAAHGAQGVTVPVASSAAWKEKAAAYAKRDPVRDYDWTYTADYMGEAMRGDEEAAWAPHTGDGIDMAMLKRTDLPILAFTDMVLFTDDLHDCGESELRLRLRLMPDCFFILLRHFLRVDGVFIRTHDTRIFHKFGTDAVIRATRLAQAPLPPLPSVAAAATPSPGPPRGSPLSTCATALPNEAEAAQRLAAIPSVCEAVEEIRLS